MKEEDLIEVVIEELNPSEKLEIFAQYPLCPILICEPNTESVSSTLEGIDFKNQTIISERVNYPISWIKLILNPIERISDEDSLDIALQVFGYKFKNSIAAFQGRELANSLYKNEIEFSPSEFIFLNSVIKSKGCEIKPPFGKNHWASTKTVTQLGLAIHPKSLL